MDICTEIPSPPFPYLRPRMPYRIILLLFMCSLITAKLQAAFGPLKDTSHKIQTPSPRQVHDTDIQWAKALEKQVASGYKPSDTEFARYTDIFEQYKQFGGDSTGQQDTLLPRQTKAVSEQEMQWAQFLNRKILDGYSPTNAEREVYQDIFNRYENAQNPVKELPKSTPEPCKEPSREEKQWAMDLQRLIQKGYQATDFEVARYTNIFLRTRPTDQDSNWRADSTIQANTQVSEQEIQWALDLEEKVKNGYQPNAQEISAYQNIAQRLQYSQTSAQDSAKQHSPVVKPVTQAELQWALDLEKKVKQGYQPTGEETNRYQDIAQRLAAQQTSDATAGADSSATNTLKEPVTWAIEWLQKTENGTAGTATEQALFDWCMRQPGFRQQLEAAIQKQGLKISLPAAK